MLFSRDLPRAFEHTEMPLSIYRPFLHLVMGFGKASMPEEASANHWETVARITKGL